MIKVCVLKIENFKNDKDRERGGKKKYKAVIPEAKPKKFDYDSLAELVAEIYRSER